MSDLQTKTLDDGSTVEISELRRDWHSTLSGAIVGGTSAVFVFSAFAGLFVEKSFVQGGLLEFAVQQPLVSVPLAVVSALVGWGVGKDVARGNASFNGERDRMARQTNQQNTPS